MTWIWIPDALLIISGAILTFALVGMITAVGEFLRRFTEFLR